MPDIDKAPPVSTAPRFGPGDLIVLAASITLLTALMTLPGETRYPDPPDFAAMDVDAKKQQFFAFLSPMISEVNFELMADRDRVQRIRRDHDEGRAPGWFDRRWLEQLAVKLEVPFDEVDLSEALRLLERRSGVVPESIVLAQAAIESGWGTSRFAVEGNNYFGQRCYSADCGLVPQAIGEDASFGVAQYESVKASVESYILNLNTHPQYLDFRARRQALRTLDEPITGLALVDGLLGYSERGSEYVEDIETMIRSNNLE